jgi:predicted dehydrogenase
MAECVITGRRPRTPGEEGLQDHNIMEAIYKSAADNRPVKLERSVEPDRFRGPPVNS